VQLALRAAVGTRVLDQLLADKTGVVKEVEEILRGVAGAFGVQVAGFGIRDVILPGDMKELLNKVTEAQKAAEASLITRREETAAMRSQANTARLLEGNPTLMRLRELEVIEKIAVNGKLTVMVGDKGLSGQVLNLLG
jgi:regulator of protease activity HflC (stomatin/prohibitin superfamily)